MGTKIQVGVDASGKEVSWDISINIGTVRRVKKELDIDLLDIDKPDSTTREKLFKDIYMIFDCIVCMLEGQFEKNGMTVAEFSDSCKEEHINAMGEAIAEELVNFFRTSDGTPSKATLMSQHLKMVRRVTKERNEQGIAALQAEIDSGEAERYLKARLDHLGNTSSGSKPESDSEPTT